MKFCKIFEIWVKYENKYVNMRESLLTDQKGKTRQIGRNFMYVIVLKLIDFEKIRKIYFLFC